MSKPRGHAVPTGRQGGARAARWFRHAQPTGTRGPPGGFDMLNRRAGEAPRLVSSCSTDGKAGPPPGGFVMLNRRAGGAPPGGFDMLNRREGEAPRVVSTCSTDVQARPPGWFRRAQPTGRRDPPRVVSTCSTDVQAGPSGGFDVLNRRAGGTSSVEQAAEPPCRNHGIIWARVGAGSVGAP